MLRVYARVVGKSKSVDVAYAEAESTEWMNQRMCEREHNDLWWK